MKIPLILLIVLSFIFTNFAQQKLSDRELEGYKGQVKSVLTEYVTIETPMGMMKKQPRIKESQYFFEKNGSLTQIIYPDANEKLIFNLIDGSKTFKSYEIRKENKNIDSISVSSDIEKPIELPEKLVPPDKRFDMKYTYEYDSQGRVKIEREYENNGHLSEKTEFKYDDNGFVIEKKINDAIAVSKFTYKYDEKGNLFEELNQRDIKGAGINSSSKNIYTDYKIDSNGNWFERKSTYYFEEDGKQVKSITIYYKTILYY